MTTKNKTAALIAILLTTPVTAADFKWWADGKTGGQINLTTSGGTTRTALPSNPTGAQAVRSGNTQAPTVVVQAVASLPIKAVGDTCTASGTTTANEGTAITADRTMLLTCQSGKWAKDSGGPSGLPVEFMGSYQKFTKFIRCIYNGWYSNVFMLYRGPRPDIGDNNMIYMWPAGSPVGSVTIQFDSNTGAYTAQNYAGNFDCVGQHFDTLVASGRSYN